MKTIRFYAYKGCDGCRRARKWLLSQSIHFEEIAIRERPPTTTELKQVLQATGKLTALFNTSGMDYRKMGMKDKLTDLTEEQALDLLTSHGNLIKRPLLAGESIHLVGFKEDIWREAFESISKE